MRLWWPVGVACACLQACSNGAQAPCTMVGAVSGVTFDLEGLAEPDPLSVHACAASTCIDEVVWADSATVDVATPKVSSGHSIRIRLQVRSADALVFAAVRTVKLQRYQPNGRGCDPTVGRARVRAADRNQLVVIS